MKSCCAKQLAYKKGQKSFRTKISPTHRPSKKNKIFN